MILLALRSAHQNLLISLEQEKYGITLRSFMALMGIALFTLIVVHRRISLALFICVNTKDKKFSTCSD